MLKYANSKENKIIYLLVSDDKKKLMKFSILNFQKINFGESPWIRLRLFISLYFEEIFQINYTCKYVM